MDTPRSSSPSKPRRLNIATIAVGVVLTLAVTATAFIAVARATDTPGFCGSTCHEMGPFHTAWAVGAHKGIACIECHVDPSPVARLEHKFVALQEVIDHIKGAPSFPLATPPDVPDSRCIRCHATVTVNNVTGFSHADHAKRGPCVKCHADAGHNVTMAALGKTTVVQAAYRNAIEPTPTAAPGSGKADIPNHLTVGCSNCHDMAAMGCGTCHKRGPNHEGRPADCTICHSAGVKFVFSHPVRTDCGTCHTPPATLNPPHTWKGDCTTCHLSGPGVDWKFTHPIINTCGDCHTPPSNLKPPHPTATDCTTCHQAGPGKSFAFTHPSSTACGSCHTPPSNSTPPHPTATDCTTCHKDPGGKWTFSHPGISANCETCHARPANHHSGTCTTCHKNPGQAWTFAHPAPGANCASCHARPSGHKSGSCQTCHKNAGKSWAFSHPAPGANCASCHARPSGHNPASCQTCHQNAGKSWAFTHPGASAVCKSCHTPPANHYGTACASCHTPRTTFSTTHAFSHPPIPRGAHTYLTWPCAKCHPNGAPAYYCSCHGNTTGPSD